MTIRVAVQMDPLAGININGDSTFALMEAAQARGHQLFVYQPNALYYDAGSLRAKAHPVTVRRVIGDHFSQGPAETLDLRDDVDVVLMRQDPPFDLSYLTAAHLLELVMDHTLVVNNPFFVRNAPEKISPLQWPDLMPPTMVARDRENLRAFRAAHQDVIIKPLYGNGGAGVFRVKPGDANFEPLLDMFFASGPEPVMAQAFVPAVSEGDKRIVLFDGEAVGAINRRPKAGDHRSNLAVGGSAEATALSARDLEICARIGPWLKERGLVFVGIDVIAGHLTEINVTSPTGLRAILATSGQDLAPVFWDCVEPKLKALQA